MHSISFIFKQSNTHANKARERLLAIDLDRLVSKVLDRLLEGDIARHIVRARCLARIALHLNA